MYSIIHSIIKRVAIVLFVCIAFAAAAQDGKLIEQTPYHLPDSTISKYKKMLPGIGPAIDSVNYYRVTYLSDGLKVKGYLAIPKKAGVYPVVIFNRGGNQEFGKITDESFIQQLGVLSSHGYVIVASQYRGNAGGEGKEEFGGKDVNDVLNCMPLLNNLPQADTARMGMFGWSRGGMMTYLALTRTTRIKAAVVGSGLADLVQTLEARPAFDSLWQAMIPGYTGNKDALLKQRVIFLFHA